MADASLPSRFGQAPSARRRTARKDGWGLGVALLRRPSAAESPAAYSRSPARQGAATIPSAGTGWPGNEGPVSNGDMRFSSEEDVYNPAEFAPAVKDWMTAKKAHSGGAPA